MGRTVSPMVRAHRFWIVVWILSWIVPVGTLLAAAEPTAAQTLDETIQRLSEKGADPPQEQPGRKGSAARPFTEVIDVRAVQVEAVVTDKGGDRVPGLTRDDFRLLVDGEPVEIDYFEEVRQGITVTEGARTVLAEARGGEPGPVAAEEQLAGRDFLVFVDDYFTERGTRRRLLKNLAENLETLAPKDRMAIVRFAGWGLEIRSEWSSSREHLAEVIEELRKESPGELTRASELASISDPILLMDDEKRAEQRSVRQMQDVLGAMGAAMRSFAETTEEGGRKLFIPITTGWGFDPTRGMPGAMGLATAELARDGSLSAPAPPLQFVNLSGAPTPAGHSAATRQGEQAQVFGDSILSPLVDTANLLGYSIYPMHLGRPNPNDLQRTSLWIVALETGGQIATEGGASTTPLVPVAADTGSYYVVGFSPEREFDNRRHRLELEVLRPEKATVRHRRSFVDLSQETRQAMATEAAIYLEGEGGDLAVTLGKPRPAGGKAIEVPLTLRIPMDWVTMVPQGGDGSEYVGDLELRVVAMDKNGRRSDTTAVPVRLSGPQPPPGSVATYETVVQIRPAEEQRLVIYLYDQVSGESKVAAVALEP